MESALRLLRGATPHAIRHHYSSYPTARSPRLQARSTQRNARSEPIPHVRPDCHIVPVPVRRRMGVNLVVEWGRPRQRLRRAAGMSCEMACSRGWGCVGMNRTVQAVDRRCQPSVGWQPARNSCRPQHGGFPASSSSSPHPHSCHRRKTCSTAPAAAHREAPPQPHKKLQHPK